MSLHKSLLIAVFLITGFLLCCDNIDSDIELSPFNQKVLFQYEHINHAWGYQHTGLLIDSSGNVYYRYKLPENWINCDSLDIISASDMDKNILGIDSIWLKIDKKELYSKFKLVDKASGGQLSQPVHSAEDAGISVYSGFIFNPMTDSYKKIVLKQVGDFRISNNTIEAEELYRWLELINIKIRKIEWQLDAGAN